MLDGISQTFLGRLKGTVKRYMVTKVQITFTRLKTIANNVLVIS